VKYYHHRKKTKRMGVERLFKIAMKQVANRVAKAATRAKLNSDKFKKTK
jgi:hypothetical protein